MFARLRSAFSAPERRSVSGLEALCAPQTASGVTVDAVSAMRCPAVFATVRVLAETLQQLPLHLYRRLPDGGRERAADHPLERLLSDAANPWTPASEFRLVLQTGLALHGNAFAFVSRDGSGVPVELIPLDSRTVTVTPDPVTMEPRYTVTTASGQRREYDRRDLLHIRSAGTKLYEGDSPIHAAREAIGLAILLEKHASGLFGRGARPAGILKYPRVLNDELLARLAKSFGSTYSGGDNAGRTAILEDGVEFVPLQLSSVDSQFLEMRRWQLEEIARVWRLPPHMIGHLERATSLNSAEMGQQFLSLTLLPILRAWTDAIAITLLSADERREYYAEFTVDDLLRADISARFAAYAQAIAHGVLSPNEARALENRGSYAGGETFTRPVNVAPVNTNGA